MFYALLTLIVTTVINGAGARLLSIINNIGVAADIGSVAAVQSDFPAIRPPIALLKSEPSTAFSTIAIDNRGRKAAAAVTAERARGVGRTGGLLGVA